MKNPWKELPLKPTLQEPIKELARLEWHEVTKVAHYYLSVDALTQAGRCRCERLRPRTGKEKGIKNEEIGCQSLQPFHQ